MSISLEKRLEDHLRKEHDISTVSTYLKEIVYGGSDGIVTTFAVVAGFSGAQQDGGSAIQISILTVLLFGLANLFADGVSMALGNYLSIKSERDFYTQQKRQEEREVLEETDRERRETHALLLSKGFTHEQASAMTDLYASNKPFWVEFMMQYELQLPNPEGENPLYTAAATFISFVSFGFIPLIPYFFITKPSPAFAASIACTIAAMTALGILRSYVIKQNMLRAIAENVLLGGISATVAYLVGVFFRA